MGLKVRALSFKNQEEVLGKNYLVQMTVGLKYDDHCCGSNPGPMMDQAIMQLSYEQLTANDCSGGFYPMGWNTYAVKFICNDNYNYITIAFEPIGQVDQRQYLFVDDVFLYEKGVFINPQCTDNITYTSVPPQFVENNNSITLSGVGTQAVYSNRQLISHGIDLKTGFWAKYGSTFDAASEDCIDITAASSPVGPLESNKQSSMVRLASGNQTSDFVVDYSVIENIYRTDLNSKSPLSAIGQVVYPNPTKGKVKIRVSAQDEELPYTLYDLAGREIERGVASFDQEIDWSKHANGVYVLKFFSSGQIYSQRIVISK